MKNAQSKAHFEGKAFNVRALKSLSKFLTIPLSYSKCKKFNDAISMFVCRPIFLLGTAKMFSPNFISF